MPKVFLGYLFDIGCNKVTASNALVQAEREPKNNSTKKNRGFTTKCGRNLLLNQKMEIWDEMQKVLF
jgi:hypothetical protein